MAEPTFKLYRIVRKKDGMCFSSFRSWCVFENNERIPVDHNSYFTSQGAFFKTTSTYSS